jgi:hypothetical protein
MRSTRLVLLTFAFAFAGSGGCGSSSDDDTNVVTAGSGARPAGSGGRTGAAAVGAGGGIGGSSTATSVVCGSTTCQSDPLLSAFVSACCADANTSTCGMTAVGGTCAPPAVSDPRCPGVNFMGAFMLASCCTPDDQCGIDSAMFGLGCMSLDQASNSGSSFGFGGAGIFPTPRACDAVGDAGM